MEKGEKYRMLPFLWKKGKGELKLNKRNKILSSEEKTKKGDQYDKPGIVAEFNSGTAEKSSSY